jgi:hypothetical protein
MANGGSPYHRARIERTLQGWSAYSRLPRNLARNVAEAIARSTPERPDVTPPF